MLRLKVSYTLQRVFSYSLEFPQENLLCRACPTVSSQSVLILCGISANVNDVHTFETQNIFLRLCYHYFENYQLTNSPAIVNHLSKLRLPCLYNPNFWFLKASLIAFFVHLFVDATKLYSRYVDA